MSGNYLNEVAMGAKTTSTVILGRMAAFTGRVVTWHEMLRSEEILDPEIDINQFARLAFAGAPGCSMNSIASPAAQPAYSDLDHH